MKKINILIFSLLIFSQIKADEGMWMLPLIEKLNIHQMQGLGCTMRADEIYSDKNISLKDAVIIFGGGCTGVVVSDKGLVFTNHHCGFGAIQDLSSVEHNYLKDGFTANELKDEIPAPGLTVKFLHAITDVTDRVKQVTNDTMSLKMRENLQDSVIKAIKDEFSKDNHYVVWVKSFYAGNQFYVFQLEEFKDVRLAFTPPSSIGKFGGDTDNWMWPRHTGDFSVFRVYADSAGKPAEYSVNNIPYQPKKSATISLAGIQPDDYTMIIGNPGSTSRYLTSTAIANRMNGRNQAMIDVRGAKQEVWKKYMRQDEAIQIAYASKYARSSNYWKNSIGMNTAIRKLDILNRKKAEEIVFESWLENHPEKKNEFGRVTAQMKRNYSAVLTLQRTSAYLRESLISGVEMPGIASEASTIIGKGYPTDSTLTLLKELYADYVEKVDMETFAVMLQTYKKYIETRYLPAVYQVISKKYKNNCEAYVAEIYKKSVFSNYTKLEKELLKGRKDFSKDPAILFRKEVNAQLKSLTGDSYTASMDTLDNCRRLYENAWMEINQEKGNVRYPDANSTMRLSFGTVKAYQPADAVAYDYITTTQGILQKEKPGDPEFEVPAKLKTCILNHDFGKYADKSGKMIVNFLSTNDITGGNSGSPVFNKNGELLGLAFDGNWESLSGDIVFEPELQRTINVDIRYILFIMDKIGNAGRLINELNVH